MHSGGGVDEEGAGSPSGAEEPWVWPATSFFVACTHWNRVRSHNPRARSFLPRCQPQDLYLGEPQDTSTRGHQSIGVGCLRAKTSEPQGKLQTLLAGRLATMLLPRQRPSLV